ncbi:hypothetical protein R3P38DRAFT_1624429 [Favolaschia claudopus]|uniref:Uncharacterized protein n=1 Tax=Favolaschia claudopus TaxID=2862362 RepID=A0AAW0AFZ8_9AGAR
MAVVRVEDCAHYAQLRPAHFLSPQIDPKMYLYQVYVSDYIYLLHLSPFFLSFSYTLSRTFVLTSTYIPISYTVMISLILSPTYTAVCCMLGYTSACLLAPLSRKTTLISSMLDWPSTYPCTSAFHLAHGLRVLLNPLHSTYSIDSLWYWCHYSLAWLMQGVRRTFACRLSLPWVRSLRWAWAESR